MSSPRLVPVLTRLVRLLSSRDAADAAIGDIYDDLAARTRMNHAPRQPHLWINLQAVKLAWSLAVAVWRHLGRATVSVVRDAARSVRRSPAHSTFVVFILTIGIAAGTVTFSVVDAVVLRPLALKSSDRLVNVPTWDTNARKSRVTPETFWAIHDRAVSLENLATAVIYWDQKATIDGVTHDVSSVRASSDVFPLLGFRAALGRVWSQEEDSRGAQVAVLGYKFWQRLGGSRAVLGRQITIGRRTFDVIGALGADTDISGLDYSDGGVWIPGAPPRSGQASFNLAVIGRMRAGVTMTAVADEIQRIVGTTDWRPEVTTFLDGYVQRIRGWMLLALGAVVLVVIIACVNAANVMLTRSFARSHELAIRSALGSSRRRLAASLMAEGLLLSLAAASCSLLFAIWGVTVARNVVMSLLPGTFRASSIALDGRVFAAAVFAAIVTGVVASLVPAWHGSRAAMAGALKDAGPTHTGRRSWRDALLAGEIACVSILLVVSWMFVASYVRVTGIDLGVDRTHLLAVTSRSPFKGTAYDLAERLQSVPGVDDVAVVGESSLPLVGWAYGGAWDTNTLEGDGDNHASVKVTRYRVTPNFFHVAGVRLLRGSPWSAADASATTPVVLDERAAATLFGAEDPIARSVTLAEPAGVYTVVGIVPHVYVSGAEGMTDDPIAYFDLPKGTSYRSLFVRTSRPADEMVSIVTDALAPFAPDTKVPFVRLTEDAIGKLTATRRFNTAVMFLFGGIGMIIGAFGIYGAMAASVAQQTREIGVRVALGATPGVIRRGVFRQAARQLAIGLGVGLPLGWYLSRGFASYLFQVTPADVSVYAGVAVLLGAVGMLSALVPASRAARTDPIQTLRAP